MRTTNEEERRIQNNTQTPNQRRDGSTKNQPTSLIINNSLENSYDTKYLKTVKQARHITIIIIIIMADNSNQPKRDSPRNSPRVPRHATQIVTEDLSASRKIALKVPLHATQVLPDVLLHAKEDLHSPVGTENNFVVFEKHLLANHLGSLGDCMIYNKETHHRSKADDSEEEAVNNSQTTPQGEPKAKMNKELMKEQSGSFDLMADVFYTEH